MKKILLLFSIIVLVSCSKDNANLVELEQDFVRNEISSLRINSESNVITSDEAINVVKLADIMAKSTTKSTSKQIADVVTISDDNGAPLMYAVNYANGQGYTLVSATKEFYPILAQVDKGTFREDIYGVGPSVLLNEYNYVIKKSLELPEELRLEMRKLWRIYEKHIVPATTKLNDFDSFITNALQGWENDENIHDYYNLTEAQNRLPAIVYSNFRDLAEIMSHPDYDYMTYAYVVEYIERNDYDANDYLISTTWNQIFPYNLSMELKEDGENNYYVGCGATAVAQIMKYYQWPSSYPWNSMPSMLDWRTVSTETILSRFLAEVAGKVRQTGKAPNVSNANSLENALVNDFNYKSSCSIVNHDASLVASSLDNNKLVLMTGQNSAKGHAWVCDGYGRSSRQIIYKLYVISPSVNLEYVTAGAPVPGDFLNNGTLFHMNWGYGGDDDGWYISSNNIISVIDGYTQQRKDIINIFPNR